MYKNCIHLTRFLSQIDRLVSFQLQIQHGSAIEDLYVYKKRLLSDVRILRVPSQPIFFIRTSITLKSFRSFSVITEAKQYPLNL